MITHVCRMNNQFYLCAGHFATQNLRHLSSSSVKMCIYGKRSEQTRMFRKWLRLSNLEAFQNIGWRTNNNIANQYLPERILQMGPDFCCLEWLSNAGATAVLMSDNTVIRNRKQMRVFLMGQGFDIRSLKKEAPKAHLLKDFNSKQRLGLSSTTDIAYNERWRHVSPIHIKAIDASDSVITDQGFKYLLECKNIEKMKLHFCDYIGDEAIATLAQGRTAKTLKHLEVVINPRISDASAYLLIKFKSLQRLHLYFLPSVTKRDAVLRQLKIGLPLCKVTFPEVYFVGLGYETEEEKAAYQKTRQKGSFISRFLG